ncbi:MAG TPA: hypothetical protein DHU63_12005 [Candidatus Marinimicrobia bacterium]|nr:MAG: hypothetical protein AUJ47_09490 [Candidatus Marinimicrobia bacterium CG1_02_48_14]HCW77245.1 hypothetical protein [Candidatus Neomarinimicrobiota bacterium]
MKIRHCCVIFNAAWSEGTDFITSINDEPDHILPIDHLVLRNYPNPFNPSTTLRYSLPEKSQVTLVIFDIRGNAIRTIKEGDLSSGWHEWLWDGRGESGQLVATGIYFARLQAGANSRVIKMVYLK